MKMAPDLKQCCIKSFQYLLDNGEVAPGDYPVYKILTDHGHLKISDSKKKHYYQLAIHFFNSIEETKPRHLRIKYVYHGKKYLKVTFKAKSMILQDYFISIHDSGKHLKDILN